MLKLIWMSDLHYDAHALVHGHDPRVRLDAAITLINTHHSDAACCIITGDMVETASPEAYTALREALGRLSVPVLPLAGNHDRRGLLRDHLPLPEGVMSEFVQYAVNADGHVLIALDTLDEGSDAGTLCPARLDWLDQTLDAAADSPVSLFMHHPPAPLGLTMLDPDGLQAADAFWAVVNRYPSVRSVYAGHVHRATFGHRGQVTLATLPSVLYQAPPERPRWDWDSFAPAQEAPKLGVLQLGETQSTLHLDEICTYELGGAPL